MSFLRSTMLFIAVVFSQQSLAGAKTCLMWPVSQDENGKWIYYAQKYDEVAPNFDCEEHSAGAVKCDNYYDVSHIDDVSVWCWNYTPPSLICQSYSLPADCIVLP